MIPERRVDGILILTLQQALKGRVEAALKERLDVLVADGDREILIDMGQVPFIDSTEVGRLIRSHLSVRRAGGRVRLFNLSARVVMLLRMSKLDTVLDIYETEEEALEHIRQSRAERSNVTA